MLLLTEAASTSVAGGFVGLCIPERPWVRAHARISDNLSVPHPEPGARRPARNGPGSGLCVICWIVLVFVLRPRRARVTSSGTLLPGQIMIGGVRNSDWRRRTLCRHRRLSQTVRDP